MLNFQTEKYDCLLNQPNYLRKTKKDYIKLCLICCLIFFPIVKILQFSYPFYVLIIIFSTIFNYFLETKKYRDFAKENNRQTIIEELEKLEENQKVNEKTHDHHMRQYREYVDQKELKKNSISTKNTRIKYSQRQKGTIN